MPESPIYLGNNRLIAFLPSGLPIVVDSRSQEVIDYAMGRGVEIENIRLLRKLLHGRSVFVDVGANVGAFTVEAADVVLPNGRVYAVEAITPTFEVLEWSLKVNQIYGHARVSIVNAAAAERSGETLPIFYKDTELGGAGIYMDRWPGTIRQDTPTIALDDLVPDDVLVDVVKIDVEGAEPFVMQGMRRIIERSPDIVVLIEVFEGIMRPTYGYEKFLDELIDAGWFLHVVEPNAKLSIVQRGAYPGGDRYFLVAKRSLVDLANVDYTIYPADLNFPTDGSSIFHGPYINIMKGEYAVRVHGKIDGEVEFFCTADAGATEFACVHVSEFAREFTFRADTPALKFEVVARSIDGSSIELEKIELIRR